MSPVCPCAMLWLSECISVHSLALYFQVLGSSLSIFELCLSVSIWALFCLRARLFCVLGPWGSSLLLLRHFLSESVYLVHELPAAIFLCLCATSLLFVCVLRPSVHWLSRSPRLGRCSRGATRTRLRELFQRPTLSSNLIFLNKLDWTFDVM